MKYSLKNLISLDQGSLNNRYFCYLNFLDWIEKLIRIAIWNKRKKTISSSRNKILFKFWSSTNRNNGFQKNVNGRTSFPLNRKSVATVCNKGFVWNIFLKNCLQWKEFLRYWNKSVSADLKSNFYWPEWWICWKISVH